MPESEEKDHSETVAIAENVLCEVFAGDVRLKMETEFDADRATVLRCRVVKSPSGVPQSVVVKKILTSDGTEFHPNSPDEMVPRFFNDWAGLEFLSGISDGDSPAAQFYGGNREKGLMVIEDLGDGRNFYGSLRGESSAAATGELIKLARALGKMHALTIRKQAVYDSIRDRLGSRPKPSIHDRRMATTCGEVRCCLWEGWGEAPSWNKDGDENGCGVQCCTRTVPRLYTRRSDSDECASCRR